MWNFGDCFTDAASPIVLRGRRLREIQLLGHDRAEIGELLGAYTTFLKKKTSLAFTNPYFLLLRTDSVTRVKAIFVWTVSSVKVCSEKTLRDVLSLEIFFISHHFFFLFVCLRNINSSACRTLYKQFIYIKKGHVRVYRYCTYENRDIILAALVGNILCTVKAPQATIRPRTTIQI